jgi:hypothetical protein
MTQEWLSITIYSILFALVNNLTHATLLHTEASKRVLVYGSRISLNTLVVDGPQVQTYLTRGKPRYLALLSTLAIVILIRPRLGRFNKGQTNKCHACINGLLYI